MQTKSANSMLVHNYRAVLKKCFWANIADRQTLLKSLGSLVSKSAIAGLIIAGVTGLAGNIEVNSQTGSVSISPCIQNITQIEESEFTSLIEENDLSATMSEDQFCAATAPTVSGNTLTAGGTSIEISSEGGKYIVKDDTATTELLKDIAAGNLSVIGFSANGDYPGVDFGITLNGGAYNNVGFTDIGNKSATWGSAETRKNLTMTISGDTTINSWRGGNGASGQGLLGWANSKIDIHANLFVNINTTGDVKGFAVAGETNISTGGIILHGDINVNIVAGKIGTSTAGKSISTGAKGTQVYGNVTYVFGQKDADNSLLTFSGNIYGGGIRNGNEGAEATARVKGDVSITINSGTYNGKIYGGGECGTNEGNIAINISGGIFNDDICCGSEGAAITGNASLIISGGQFAADKFILGAGQWGSVAGIKTLIIDGDVNIASTVKNFDVIQVNAGKTATINNYEQTGMFVKNGDGNLNINGAKFQSTEIKLSGGLNLTNADNSKRNITNVEVVKSGATLSGVTITGKLDFSNLTLIAGATTALLSGDFILGDNSKIDIGTITTVGTYKIFGDGFTGWGTSILLGINERTKYTKNTDGTINITVLGKVYDLVWTGVDGVWGSDTNTWDDTATTGTVESMVFANGDSISFNKDATIDLQLDVIPKKLSVTAGNVIINSTTNKITGESAIEVAGGSLTLNMANDYTGGTTITSGTLKAEVANSLGSGSVTIGTNGKLVLAGAHSNAIINNGILSLNGATLTGDLTLNNNSFVELTGDNTTNTLTIGSGISTTFSGTGSLKNAIVVNGTLVVAGDISIADISVGVSGVIKTDGENRTITGNLQFSPRGGDGTPTLTIGEIGAKGKLTINGTFNYNIYWSYLDIHQEVEVNQFTVKGNGFNKTVRISEGASLIVNSWGGHDGNNTNSEGFNISGSGTLVVKALDDNGGTLNLLTIKESTKLVFDTTTDQTQGGAAMKVIGGAGSVEKRGDAILTITAANTYTGGTTISAGTLVMGHANALGTGAVTFAGGTLSVATDATLSNLNGTSKFKINVVENVTATLASLNMLANDYEITGAGTLSYIHTSGNVTFGNIAKTWNISKGATLSLTADNSNDVLVNAKAIGDGLIQLSAAKGTLILSNFDATQFTGVIAVNAARVNLQDGKQAGTLRIDGTVNLRLRGSKAIRTADLMLDVNGKEVQINLEGNDRTYTFNGLLGDVNSVVNQAGGNTGCSVKFVSDVSGFSGNIYSSSNLKWYFGDGANAMTLNNDSTLFGAGAKLGNTGATNLYFNLGAQDFIMNANVIGAATITKEGVGTMTINTANTYTGDTTISGGKVILTGAGTLGTGNIVNNAALEINKTENTTITGVISGTGSLTNSGAGILTLDGANTYTGGTTISGGTVIAGNAKAFGEGAVNLALGTLDLSAIANSTTTALINNAITLTAESILKLGAITADGTYKIFGGEVTNWDLLDLTKISIEGITTGGRISLTSTTVGEITIAGLDVMDLVWNGGDGTWSTDVNSKSWDNSVTTGLLETINFVNGDSVNFNNTTAKTTNVITIEGNVAPAEISVTGVGNITFDGTGSIVDNGETATALTKTGSGILTIKNANSYTGITTISEGTVVLTGAGTLGTGNIVNNAALEINKAEDSTISNIISGGGTLTKDGSGTLTIDGANTYEGGTTITSGTVVAGNAKALGTGNVALNGGTLDLGDLAVANNITCAGGTISNASAYTGTVTMNENATLTSNTIIKNVTGNASTVYNYTGASANVTLGTDLVSFEGTLNNTSTEATKTLTLTGGEIATATPTFTVGTSWNKLEIVNQVTYNNAFAGEIAITGTLTSSQVYSKVSGAGTYNYTGTNFTADLSGDDFSFTGILNNTGVGSEDVLTLQVEGNKTFNVGSGWETVNKTGTGVLTLGGNLSAIVIDIKEGVLALDSTAQIIAANMKSAAETTLELVAGVTIGGVVLSQDNGASLIAEIKKQTGFLGNILFVLNEWSLDGREVDEIASMVLGSTGAATVITSSKDIVIKKEMGLGTKTFAKLDITGGTATVADIADLTTSEIAIAKDATFVQTATGQLTNGELPTAQNTTISGTGTFQIGNSAAEFALNGFTGTLATTVNYDFSGKTITGATVVNVIGDVKAIFSEAQIESSDLASITGKNVDVVVNGDDVGVTVDLTKVAITGTLNATTADQTLLITGAGLVDFTIGGNFSIVNLDGSGVGQTLDMAKTSANTYNVTGGIVTLTGDIATGKTVNAQAGETTITDNIAGTVEIVAGATVNNDKAVTGKITGAGTFNYTGTTDFTVNVETAGNFGDFAGTLNNGSGGVVKTLTGGKEIGLILNNTEAGAAGFDYGNNWSSVTKTGAGELSVVALHNVFNINEGTVKLAVGTDITYAGTITIKEGASFNVASDLTLSGKITGAGNLSVTGDTILSLTENSAIVDETIIWANTDSGTINLFDGAQVGGFTVGSGTQDQVLSWIKEMEGKGYEVIYVLGQFSGNLDVACVNGVWDNAKLKSYLAAADIKNDTVLIGTTGNMPPLIIDYYKSFATNTEIKTLVIGAGADVTLNANKNLISTTITMAGGKFTVGASDLTGKTVSGTGNILTTVDFTAGSNFNDFKGTISGTTATSTLTVKEAIVDYVISNYDNVKVQGTTTFNNVVSTNKLEIDEASTLNVSENFVYSGALNGAATGIINSNNSKFVGNTGSSYNGSLTGSATLTSSAAFKNATVSNATLTIQGFGNELGTVENTSFIFDLGAGGFVGAPMLSISTDNNANKVLAITTNNVINGKIELLSSSTVNDYQITINNGEKIAVGSTIQTSSGKYILEVINGILTLTAYTYTNPNNSEQVVEAYDSSAAQAETVVQAVNSAQNLTNIISNHISTNMISGGAGTIDNLFMVKNLTSQDRLMASTNSGVLLLQERDSLERFNVWGQAIYSRAENGGSNNFGDSTENSYGGMVGFEMSSSGNYNHGLFITGLSSDIKGDNGSKTEGEGVYLGYYAGMRISDNYFANFGGMVGLTQIDTERRGGLLNEKITGKYDSRILSIFGELGRNFQITDNVYTRASVGTQYSFVMNEDYKESTGGNNVDSLNISSWTVGLDARLGYKFQRGYIEGRLGVVAELLDTEIESDFTIIDNPGALYTSQGGELDAAKVVIGIESGYRLSDNWSVKGGVLGEFGDSNQRITGNITFMFTW